MKAHEKIPKVIEALDQGFTDDEFIEKFQEMFPKEWQNVNRRYNQHERLTKEGKSHPMPEPKKYLLLKSHKYLKQVRDN
ncbi:MAG: hypothetical protein GX947_07650 [Tissierellia bacterium]|nr:hypothetical protein [Tissierellia bacterium]